MAKLPWYLKTIDLPSSDGWPTFTLKVNRWWVLCQKTKIKLIKLFKR